MSATTIIIPDSIVPASRPSPRDSTTIPSPKRLRSCLSPTRSRPSIPYSTCSSDESYFPFTPMTSRSTSFSSAEDEAESSDAGAGRWRRSKSVRWEGEEEGSAVTSYHATWSSLEYDRSPLEPPSEGERACVLPERGSRCLSPVTCFGGAVFADPEEFAIEDVDVEIPPPRIAFERTTTMDSDSESEDNDADADAREDGSEESEEDREWEECMERRRMMFASMQASSPGGGAPRAFEGYTSLSAALADVLRSSGQRCDGPSTPLEGVVDHLPLPAHLVVSHADDLLRTPELSSSGHGDSPPESMLGSPAATLSVPRIVIGGTPKEEE